MSKSSPREAFVERGYVPPHNSMECGNSYTLQLRKRLFVHACSSLRPFPPFPLPLFLHRILFLASSLGTMVCRIVQDCPVMVGRLSRQPRSVSHWDRGDTGAPGLRPHALA